MLDIVVVSLGITALLIIAALRAGYVAARNAIRTIAADYPSALVFQSVLNEVEAISLRDVGAISPAYHPPQGTTVPTDPVAPHTANASSSTGSQRCRHGRCRPHGHHPHHWGRPAPRHPCRSPLREGTDQSSERDTGGAVHIPAQTHPHRKRRRQRIRRPQFKAHRHPHGASPTTTQHLAIPPDDQPGRRAHPDGSRWPEIARIDIAAG